jgi:hypothetical protein
MPFTCSICGEESTRICVWCTKDACDNHICEKCGRCSDCCECEVRLSEPAREARPMVRPVVPAAEEEAVEPEPAGEPTPAAEPEAADEPEPGEPAL